MIRAAALAAMLLTATPAAADRALLIGVGDYPALSAPLRLAAPEEDARRVGEALVAAGFARADITVMTSAAGRPPTVAAVLAALDTLAREAVPGEQVLVYFSGHGAQVPTRTPVEEPDGFDEIYLLRDARAWNGGRNGEQLVPGSLSDKALARALAAIRAGGADVWFVADACHAGGLLRTGGDARTKAVPTAALGIPARRARAVAVRPTPQPQPGGAFAGFYAAAPGALAVERRLPAGAPDATPWSQFSFALVRALAAGRVRSLRDLALAVEAADAGIGGDAPRPLFEGALDRPVLSLAPDRPRRYPVVRRSSSTPGAAEIAAGVEEGVAPGDRLLLFRPGGTEPVGQARAATVALGVSRLDGAPPGALEAVRALGSVPLATREAALLAAIGPLAGRGAAASLRVDMRLARPGAARACPAAPAGAPVDPLSLPVLAQCDVLSVTITNAGEDAVDLSALYVDAAGTVAGLGFVGGGEVRVPPGDRRQVAIRLLSITRDGRALPVGVERLALVALPATAARPRDLRPAATLRGAGDALEPGAGALVFRWEVGR